MTQQDTESNWIRRRKATADLVGPIEEEEESNPCVEKISIVTDVEKKNNQSCAEESIDAMKTSDTSSIKLNINEKSKCSSGEDINTKLSSTAKDLINDGNEKENVHYFCSGA